MQSIFRTAFLLIVTATSQATSLADTERVFQVRLSPEIRNETSFGRLIVFLIADQSKIPKRTAPVDLQHGEAHLGESVGEVFLVGLKRAAAFRQADEDHRGDVIERIRRAVANPCGVSRGNSERLPQQ